MGDPEKKYHVPVLLNETIAILKVSKGKWYVDATAGGGGHTEKILAAGGRVLAIDEDPDAIAELNRTLESKIRNRNLIIRKGNFSQITEVLNKENIEDVTGVLFDLGISTHQINGSGRGFSYTRDEPLDMRFSTTGISAEEIINTYSEENLYEIFRKFGEEQLARPIAHALIFARTLEPIRTTKQLTTVIDRVVGEYDKGRIRHLSRIYQALRIEVNREIENLKEVLPQAVRLLRVGGTGVIISFHSLEDRAVKLFLKGEERKKTIRILTSRPIIPTSDEVRLNRRARSAKMRAFERI